LLALVSGERENLVSMEKGFWLLQSGEAVTQGPILPGNTSGFGFVINLVSPIYMVHKLSDDFMRFAKLRALLNFEFHRNFALFDEYTAWMNTDVTLYFL